MKELRGEKGSNTMSTVHRHGSSCADAAVCLGLGAWEGSDYGTIVVPLSKIRSQIRKRSGLIDCRSSSLLRPNTGHGCVQDLRHVFPFIAVAVPGRAVVVAANGISPNGVKDVALRF